MSSFDDREKGFERQFQRDEELRFRVTARRNKLLGLWAAEQFAMAADAAEAYAREVVLSDFSEPGDADVVKKVLDDFESRGVAMDERRLRRQMERLMGEARSQIQGESA